MNIILNREKISNDIKDILQNFEVKCKNINYKKGIYIYGSPGCGKTRFVMNILQSLDYDIIKYDAGDIRNKSLFDTMTCNNVSDKNVLHMMNKKIKKIAIVMDEIDGMNNGDKGGITSLIKLIRQKKTKKQKIENITMMPIICIGNYYSDKKIKELMKVCNVFELQSVTKHQISTILTLSKCMINHDITNYQYNNILNYIQGDLRKLEFIITTVSNNNTLLQLFNTTNSLLRKKSHNDDVKNTTYQIIKNNDISLQHHYEQLNETERTIISLLYHENIIDPLFHTQTTHHEQEKRCAFYSQIMQNICFADYMDRITYQNQIWIFNEMTSIIKIFWSNHLYHKQFQNNSSTHQVKDIRFTKVLTKYSTEYNNQIFIYNLCQQLDLDKKDMLLFFFELRIKYVYTDIIIQNVGNVNISILDIKRIYRYIDKITKTSDETISDHDSIEED
jgi:DNA polymerase III delta prime subunit